MKIFTVSLLLTIGVLNLSYSQKKKEEESKVEIALEGILGMTVADNFFSVNVGGPSLLLRLSPAVKVGVGAFPSFFVRDSKTGARLAVGPRVDVKNFVVFGSFFHFDRTDEWVSSFGLGYKFHARK
jgi:hypothetical protein